MTLPHPGTRSVGQPSLVPYSAKRVGMVLKCYDPLNDDGSISATGYEGKWCDVLLLDALRIVRDVWIPVMGGHADAEMDFGLMETKEPLRQQIYDAAAAFGTVATMPPPYSTEPKNQWGSKVIVDWLEGGKPFVAHCLKHPSAGFATSSTYGGSAGSPQAESAKGGKPGVTPSDGKVEKRLSSQMSTMKVAIPPQHIAYAISYDTFYTNGYKDGAINAAYTAMASLSDTQGRFNVSGVGKAEEDAIRAGRANGWRDGWSFGMNILRPLRSQAPTTPAENNTPTQPPTPTAGDATTPTTTAARLNGAGMGLKHGGTRMLASADGAVIDTRDAGKPIYLQVAAGAEIHFACDDGTEVVIKDGKVHLGGTDGEPAPKWETLNARLDALATAVNTAIKSATIVSVPGGGYAIGKVVTEASFDGTGVAAEKARVV